MLSGAEGEISRGIILPGAAVHCGQGVVGNLCFAPERGRGSHDGKERGSPRLFGGGGEVREGKWWWWWGEIGRRAVAKRVLWRPDRLRSLWPVLGPKVHAGSQGQLLAREGLPAGPEPLLEALLRKGCLNLPPGNA